MEDVAGVAGEALVMGIRRNVAIPGLATGRVDAHSGLVVRTEPDSAAEVKALAGAEIVTESETDVEAEANADVEGSVEAKAVTNVDADATDPHRTERIECCVIPCFPRKTLEHLGHRAKGTVEMADAFIVSRLPSQCCELKCLLNESREQ